MAEPWPTAADRQRAATGAGEQPTDAVPGEGDDVPSSKQRPQRRKRKRPKRA